MSEPVKLAAVLGDFDLYYMRIVEATIDKWKAKLT